LGYAVNQFFANGGQQAYIVRLVANDAATAKATVALQLNPGQRPIASKGFSCF